MADPQADNLYRNDNKGLSSGSQSADLSRSGGTPEEQQTAPDPHAAQADQDTRGDPSTQSAAAPPPEPSGSARTGDAPDGGGSGPDGSSATPPASPGQQVEPAAGTDGGARDGGFRAEAAQDGELTLGGDVDWTGPDGSQHERSAEITIDGSTATSAGADGATASGFAPTILDIPASPEAATASVAEVLDRADQTLDPVAGLAGGAASALTEVGAAASGASAAAVDALGGAVAAAADIGGLADPATGVLGQAVDPGTTLAEPAALADLSGALPEVVPVAPAEAGQGLLAGLFDPARGDVPLPGGDAGADDVLGLADGATAGLLGSPDQDEGSGNFDLGL